MQPITAADEEKVKADISHTCILKSHLKNTLKLVNLHACLEYHIDPHKAGNYTALYLTKTNNIHFYLFSEKRDSIPLPWTLRLVPNESFHASLY